MLLGINNLHRVTSFLSVNIFNDVTTSVLIDTDIQTNHNSLWTTWTEKCTISDINLSSRLCFTKIAGKYCKVYITQYYEKSINILSCLFENVHESSTGSNTYQGTHWDPVYSYRSFMYVDMYDVNLMKIMQK